MTSPALSPLAGALARSGFAALPASEFMRAYRAADAEISRGSKGRRSFTVEVAAGDVVCVLTVQLGRGLNSQECRAAVRRSRGEPDPEPPYPRPIIGGRSHLEVVSREIVDVLGQVARARAA
ncbi:hypothetical protein [Amycolatopsis keratiniphila]|uniref:Uncharacterized protein n=1 Tax=Amycolatopsis keratiniphila TaxID=129921 RepID=R4TGN2_9PSEU|nr:hypothetical protein [Amycolatopsis keratiniphila]AGM09448.1 hypothetical protein AORI_6866 [Amycolatopsis keratiniphila]